MEQYVGYSLLADLGTLVVAKHGLDQRKAVQQVGILKVGSDHRVEETCYVSEMATMPPSGMAKAASCHQRHSNPEDMAHTAVQVERQG